nr:MAG TPA: hypothetical protein [Caudoviricetes sp.]
MWGLSHNFHLTCELFANILIISQIQLIVCCSRFRLLVRYLTVILAFQRLDVTQNFICITPLGTLARRLD